MSAMELLFGWRPDFVLGTAAVLLAVVYLIGVRRVPGWPRGRTVLWLLGCAVVLVATSSGIGRYAPVMVSMLVTSHALLAVVAPLLLVLGGPVSLALRALPRTARPRAWLIALLRSRVWRALTRPAVVFVLLLGPFYVLYVAGGLDVVLGSHLVVNAVFLAGGYAFFWSVIGADPGVRRLPQAGRVGLMAALLLGFGYLAVVVSNAHEGVAGSLLWALGELPVLVVLMATAGQWARSDERAAARADNDADLASYNDMLAGLAAPDRR